MSRVTECFLDNEEALKRYLQRFVDLPQDVEDLAQEAFLKAYSFERKSDVRTAKAFLFTIARNTALNHRAKEAQRRTCWASKTDVETLPCEASFCGERMLNSKLAMLTFSKALGQLPPSCRRVFKMQKLEGMKNAEISRKLGISLSGVEKHVAQGISRCRTQMKQRGIEPHEIGYQ